MEEQLYTRHEENKITLKRYLVVFFFWLFVVHRSLKKCTETTVRKRDTCKRHHHTQGFEDGKNHSLLTTRSSNRRKNIGRRNTSSSTGLQSFTTKTEGWRNQILTQNISKEQVEVVTTQDSQLHLLTDTPTTKIWREPSDLAEPTLTSPLSVPDRTSSR